MDEKAPKAENSGELEVSEKELHPAWPIFKKFGILMGVNFLTGTDWIGPWLYFKAGWDMKEK